MGKLRRYLFCGGGEDPLDRRIKFKYHLSSHLSKFKLVYLILPTMPKENKKRGRREEKKKKRKWEEEDIEEGGEENIAHGSIKRQKSQDEEEQPQYIPLAHDMETQEAYTADARLGDLPFYGLLDEEEQEYFKRADSMLELNQFGEAEERELFLANVYKEANGKELKLANSQSCSRLMERLILLSTAEQLKTLFQKFNGQ